MDNKKTAKQILTYGVAAVTLTMLVYVLARATGTQFIVEAPPALLSPIPWWLFLTYSLGGVLAMFPLVAVSNKFSHAKVLANIGVTIGLLAMTPAPFLVTDDFATLVWLNLTHLALVAPLFLLIARLEFTPGNSVSKGSEHKRA